MPKRRVRPRTAPQFMSLTPDLIGGVAIWRAGSGPPILMVHGWEDDHSLWAPMIDSLIESGFGVVALDLPGHGYSPAECGTVIDCGASVAGAVAQFGPFHGVIAHSFGCPVSALAMREHGLLCENVVLIAAARAQRDQLNRIAARYGLSAAETAKLIGDFEQRMGRPIDRFDLADWAKTMTQRALIVHSMDDDACPFEGAEAIAAHWPSSELYLTDQLGHRLVAQDRATITRICQFLE